METTKTPPIMDVTSNGKTVWVNSSSKGCVARFCQLSLELMPNTATFSVRSEPTKHDGEDWDRFKAMVSNAYGVAVSDEHEPVFSKNDRLMRGS